LKVSVIIPYYKNAEVIGRTLNSVLEQSHQNFEIIIVNDNSPDAEKLTQVISKLNRHEIRLINHNVNKKGSAARNTGMLNSTGDFIAFLDADDEWSKSHLEQMINLALNRPEKFCLYPKSIIKTSINNDLVLPENSIEANESVADYLFTTEGFIQSSGLFLKNPCEIWWDEKLVRHQDYDFIFKLEAAGYKFFHLSQPTVTIHWENNDITKKGGTWQFSLDYWQNHKDYFSLKSSKAFIFKNCIQPLLKSGSRSKALQLNRNYLIFSSLGFKMKLLFIDLFIFKKPILLKFLSKLKAIVK